MGSIGLPGISGQIAGVNLSSFLQLIEMEQKTCMVKVLSKKDMGKIFFVNGTIFDAETIHLRSLDALYDILSWNNTVIEVEKNNSKNQNNINLPLMHLLMEAARYSDEKSADPDTDQEKSPGSDRDIPQKMIKTEEFCLEIGVRLLV